jgi:hypothetical protein
MEFHFYPEPDPEPAGVTPAYLYLWDGTLSGPATAIPVVMVSDGDHGGFIEPTGPAERVTITDD